MNGDSVALIRIAEDQTSRNIGKNPQRFVTQIRPNVLFALCAREQYWRNDSNFNRGFDNDLILKLSLSQYLFC